jgi:hypothetical protein
MQSPNVQFKPLTTHAVHLILIIKRSAIQNAGQLTIATAHHLHQLT